MQFAVRASSRPGIVLIEVRSAHWVERWGTGESGVTVFGGLVYQGYRWQGDRPGEELGLKLSESIEQQAPIAMSVERMIIFLYWYAKIVFYRCECDCECVEKGTIMRLTVSSVCAGGDCESVDWESGRVGWVGRVRVGMPDLIPRVLARECN